MLSLAVKDILRSVSEESLGIFHRFAGTVGYLLPFEDLIPDDMELGTLIVPNPDQMPNSARAFVANGVLSVPKNSVVAVAASLLMTGEAVITMFSAPDAGKVDGFVPDEPVKLTLATIEVSAREMEALRRTLAAVLEPERVEAARASQKVALGATTGSVGKNSHRLFSEALDAYSRDFLPTLRCRSELAAADSVFGVVLLPTHSPNRKGVSPHLAASSRRIVSQAHINAAAR